MPYPGGGGRYARFVACRFRDSAARTGCGGWIEEISSSWATSDRWRGAAIDSVLRQSERTLRRSRQVLADVADTVEPRDPWLADIDDALDDAGAAASGRLVIDLRDEVVDPP